MKIAISGAHGSGKTSIAKGLLKDLSDVVDLSDFVIRFFKPKYGLPEINIESQCCVLHEWIRVATAHQDKSFMIDRSPIDHIVYARVFGYSTEYFEREALEALSLVDDIFIIEPLLWPDDHKSDRIYGEHVQIMYQQKVEDLLLELFGLVSWDHRIAHYKFEGTGIHLIPRNNIQVSIESIFRWIVLGGEVYV